MLIARFIGLFHVKHTNRPGQPGRIRLGLQDTERLPVQREPACM